MDHAAGECGQQIRYLPSGCRPTQVRISGLQWLVSLLFSFSAKGSIAQVERLPISPLAVTRLHLQHAIVVGLHVSKVNVVILTPETVCSFGVFGSRPSWLVGFSIQDEAMDAARSTPQGAHYHADVINLLPLLGIKKEA